MQDLRGDSARPRVKTFLGKTEEGGRTRAADLADYESLANAESERIRPRFYRRILIRPDQFRTLHSESVAHSRTRRHGRIPKGTDTLFVVGTVVCARGAPA